MTDRFVEKLQGRHRRCHEKNDYHFECHGQNENVLEGSGNTHPEGRKNACFLIPTPH
jgi:hypothetical protein